MLWLLLLMASIQSAFIRFAGGVSTAADLGTYTFTAAPVGEPAADRFIAVVVAAKGPNIPGSVTIGGQPCSGVVTGLSANSAVRIYISNSPFVAGTTADIIVNVLSGEACAIGVFPIYGLQSNVAVDTNSSVASGTPMALDVAEGGVVVAGAISNGTSFTSDITENIDSVIDTNVAFFAGRKETPIEQSLNVTITASGSSNFTAISAAFR